MKPYVRALRYDVFERRKDYRLRIGLKRQITIPIKLSRYILNEKMILSMWINEKKRLEIAAIPTNFKKTNGIVLLRRILTNGHSYAFVIPPAVYETLADTYETRPIKDMKILVNSRNNLELMPISGENLSTKRSRNDAASQLLNRE